MKKTNTTASTVEAKVKQHTPALAFIALKGLLFEYLDYANSTGHKDPEAEALAEELDDNNYLEDDLGGDDNTLAGIPADDMHTVEDCRKTNLGASTKSSCEKRCAAVTAVSQGSRDYLVLYGKLSDACAEFRRLKMRDSVDSESITKEAITEFEDTMAELTCTVLAEFRYRVQDNLDSVDCTEI